VYIVLSYPNQKYDPHINRHRFPPKIFKMEPNAERLVKIFSNVIVYLFVDMYVPIVYRVASSSTKSMTLAFTDIGFQNKKNLSK
jgi:hypothetical protein